MMMQNGGQSPSDTRLGLVILSAFALAGLIWGLHILHDWFRPHQKQAGRIAALESELSSLETRCFAAEQYADEAAEEAGAAKWMGDALAAVADVFKIDGVLEAARRAARKALHPDAHPGTSEHEIRDLTARFQHAEAVFDRFSN